LYFPEGGVPDDESLLLDTFKDGAFRLAIEHQILIVPISFADNKETLLYFFSAVAPG
jgi:1-acyl-sn-glycerol-3-phosphate acyltransferase